MNLKNLLAKLSLVVVLLTFFAANSFAQVYVSNTNGNDITGDGTQASPYATILKGYQAATNGQTVYIDADTYGEATLNLNSTTKSVTFSALTFNALNTVTITNGVTVAAGSKTITFDAAGQNFDFGSSATALTLTSGTCNLSTNVTIGDGGTITRTDGSLVGTPTFAGDVNVTYNAIAATTISAGTELPADIAGGTLTVNIGATKTITFANTLTVDGGAITVTTGNANFNGALDLTDVVFTNTPNGNTVTVNGDVAYTIGANTSPLITNNGTGTLKFMGNLGFTHATAGAADYTVQIRNNSTGTLTVDKGYTTTATTVSGTSYKVHVNMQNTGASPAKLTFNGTIAANSGTLTNSSTGTITLTGGTIGGNVDNGTGGILVLNANTTFQANLDNSNAASVVKLNGYTLTLSGAAKTLDNSAGKIYADATASTVGAGTLAITGSYTTGAAGGEFPNITVSGSGGSFKLGANEVVYGNFTIAGSKITGGTEAFNDGGFDLTVYGNFARTNNTVGNVAATGSLTFKGTAAQAFNPGASLTLTDVIINKTSSKVTLGASVKINGDFTITAGELELGNYNINMINGGTFDNSGSFYSTTNVGYLNFETNGGFITGTGTFGNILINSDGSTLALSSNVDFSGTLYIFEGDLDLNNFAFNMTDDLVTHPTVKINTDPTTSAIVTDNSIGAGGTFDAAAGVTFNLDYTGALGAAYTAGMEWDNATNSTKIFNLTVETTGATTVTGPGGASTIAGTLTVDKGQTLDLNGQTATLSGDDMTHSVKGTVTDLLLVTGTGVALNGGASTDDNAINNLEIDNTADGTFTSTGLEVVNDLTNTTGTSSVTLSTSAAALNGTVTVTAGQLTLNLGKATDIGTDLVVNGGTYILGDAQTVDGDITHTGTSSITLGNFDLTAANDYTHNNTSTFTAGTGSLVFDASADAAGTITLTTDVTVPNVEINAPAGVITLAGTLTVSNAFTFTDGTFDLDGNDLVISGNTFNFDVATPSAFEATSAASNLIFEGDATVITVTDASDTWGNAPDFSTSTNTLNVEVNSAGSVTFADDADNGPFTFTVDGDFTQTAGTVALGDNNLNVLGDFVRTEGSWTMGDGFLQLAGANYTAGTGWSIDNLEIQASMGDTDDEPFTVTKNLLLTAGTFTTTTAGNLTLADGATVERVLTTAVLGEVPTFGNDISVIYSGAEAGDLTTDNELPATVKDLTINRSTAAPNNDVLLNDDLTVTGTLYLTDGILNENGNALTLGAGATLSREAGGSMLAGDVPTVTTYNLVYTGGTSFTTAAEDFMTGMTSLTVKMGAGAFVKLHASKTISGDVTLNSNATGGLDMDNRTLTVTGNVTVTAGLWKSTNASAGSLKLNGTTAQTFTVPSAGFTFPSSGPVSIEINNSSAEGVTLAGGNLTMNDVDAANIVKFNNGVLNTGSNTLVLWHGDDGSQPLQGFSRGVTGSNESHVYGNVKKYIDATGTATQTTTNTVALTRVEFPVGNTTDYRPMAFQFNTLPSANFNLTVSEVEASPAGTNGFPLTSGDLTITNYPDFYWLVKSDLTLQPQVKYDIEASAAGYTDYQTDGIQNIRFIRRFDNNVDNPWLVQGGSGYDNSTNVTTPVVIVRDAQGAISSQGARFTYSQLNKAPVLSHPADVAKNEGETVTIAWTATDPDIGQTATMAVVSKPAAATFNATTNTLTWVTAYADAGTHSIIVSATDGVLTSYDTVSVVITNTNRAPSFVATGAQVLPNSTMKSGETLNFTYLAVDPDSDPITYTVVSLTPALAGTSSLDAALGTFEFKPLFGDAGKVFTVKVEAKDASKADTTTATITVNYPVVKGDVNADGAVDAADASMILKYVVDPTNNPLDTQEFWAADVNNTQAGDGVVGAYDAALILYYYANTAWPAGAKSSAVAGLVDFGQIQSQNGVVNMPLNISATSGVLSVYTEIDINDGVEVEGVTSRLPEGWSMYNNVANNKIKIAMAGTTPLNEGTIAVLSLKLKNKEAAVNIQASANLNDQLNSSLSANVREIPTEFALSQNYPNPFNPTTTIKFAVAEKAPVTLNIYNMLGQKVKTLVDSEQEAGFYTVNWDGTNDFGSRVASGIYIYRITAGKFTSTMKMNLLK